MGVAQEMGVGLRRFALPLAYIQTQRLLHNLVELGQGLEAIVFCREP